MVPTGNVVCAAVSNDADRGDHPGHAADLANAEDDAAIAAALQQFYSLDVDRHAISPATTAAVDGTPSRRAASVSPRWADRAEKLRLAGPTGPYKNLDPGIFIKVDKTLPPSIAQ